MSQGAGQNAGQGAGQSTAGRRTVHPQLREQAVALRRAGRSRREIREILAITSNETLNEALRGEPPQPWTWRPNAKDDLRARARALREQGLAYQQIVAELGVSKSTVSAWVSDMAPGAAQLRGMPPEIRRRRPPVLDHRAPAARGQAGSR
jgi:hypothetical protein